MVYVYAIQSLTRKYIYVGLTIDIHRRMAEHQGGMSRTTKPYRPFKLLMLEEFSTRAAARQREKYLKPGIGKEYLKSILLK